MENLFKLRENNTTVRTEVLAGITTFLTMAYIIIVNPQILSAAGMNQDSVFMATCIAAAFGSMFMGLYANYPIALAPGMGLNAYFAFVVVGGMHHSWQVALGAVFISGIIFFLISAFKIREIIVNAIPMSLKMGISAGIGLFLGFIGLRNAGVIAADQATFVHLGNVRTIPVLLALLGFGLMIGLTRMKVTGAIIISIIAVWLIGIPLGVAQFGGVFAAPPSIAPTLLQMDLWGAMQVGLWTIVFVFLFVDLFDNTGTLIGVAHRGKMLDAEGKLPRIGKALMVDSSSAMVGAALGTSTTTSYIESTAGVEAGGRTGLTAVVVGLLFLAAVFISPLARSIPPYATAPALVFVACLMARSLTEVDWEDVTEYVPAVIVAIAMPLTFSIAEGIGLGFIVYVVGKLLSGRPQQVNPAVWIIAAAFVVRLAIS